MSTAVPADGSCYVKHCYHYTADSYAEQDDCITAVYPQSYAILLGKYKMKLFHNKITKSRFTYNKKESYVLLLLLVVLLIPLLQQPQPPQPPKTKGNKTTTTSIINNATTTTNTTTTTTATNNTTTGQLQQ
jgi:hypothetical protein